MKTLIFFLTIIGSCFAIEVRVENLSDKTFENVHLSSTNFGNITPNETSEFLQVDSFLRYVILKLYIDGKYLTGQTLNFGSTAFTYQIKIKDADKGLLDIKVVPEKQ